MKALIALPLALGFALAAPVSVYATPRTYGPDHHARALRHRSLAMRAEATAPVTVLAPARARAFGDTETDGLSRNPDDCVTYGCIDSGGG
jgi:hypothetical protein